MYSNTITCVLWYLVNTLWNEIVVLVLAIVFVISLGRGDCVSVHVATLCEVGLLEVRPEDKTHNVVVVVIVNVVIYELLHAITVVVVAIVVAVVVRVIGDHAINLVIKVRDVHVRLRYQAIAVYRGIVLLRD